MVHESALKIDRLMASAWPSVVTEEHDGWRFRYSRGVTRRANSVLALGSPNDLHTTVDRAERFYRSHGAPPVFLASDAAVPRSVIRSVEELGYEARSSTWMLTGRADVVSASLTPAAGWTIDARSEPTDDWFATYWGVESGRHGDGADHIMRNTLLRPEAPAVFVTAYDAEGTAAAVGQVVIDDGWGCLQCLATAPAGRRKGAATAVFKSLAERTMAAGGTEVFAAVVEDNEPSLGLCHRAGLQRSHRYRYLVPTEDRAVR